MMHIVFLLLLAPCAALLSGCASHPTAGGDDSALAFDPRRLSDAERLKQIWQLRTHGESSADFPIGPGDVIELTVVDLPELEARTVRVSSEGTFSLPLLGEIRAAGRTEAELAQDIQQRLQDGVMYDPPVNLFVREYRSRLVGVIGAVVKPGLYPIAGGSDTILDMLALAGGMNQEAAPRIHFLPAPPPDTDANPLALPLSPVGAMPTEQAAGRDPIRIDLDSAAAEQLAAHLLPVRPGDLIIVPERGDVLVKGWVARPGAHPISPGLTILGAVSAAGGPRFEANTNRVRVYRQTEDGSQVSLSANLGRIQRGLDRDFPVEGGDVVEVPATPPKLILASVYKFFISIFNVGMGIGFL